MKRISNILLVLTCILCSCNTDDMEDFENAKILMPPGIYVIDEINHEPVEDGQWRDTLQFTRHTAKSISKMGPGWKSPTYSIVKENDRFFLSLDNEKILEAATLKISDSKYNFRMRMTKSKNDWINYLLRKI